VAAPRGWAYSTAAVPLKPDLPAGQDGFRVGPEGDMRPLIGDRDCDPVLSIQPTRE
jgi:hypothetical protein